MAFIDRIVGPDEDLIGILSVHWIYGAKGILWMAAFTSLGLFIDGQVGALIAGEERYAGIVALDVLSHYAFMTSTIIGVIIMLFYIVMMLTTELGLTDKRVIYKRGWIAVDVKESDLEEIKAADIDNGILGRILNYGYVNFDARFVENVRLPAISDPYRFVKAMNEARSDLKEDSMTIVLDGAGAAHNKSVKRNGREKRKTKRDMSAERYEGLESDPLEAMEDIVEDVRGMPKQNKDKQKRADFATSRPILFKRDVQRHKANLRKKIKNAFARKSAVND